MWSFINFTDFLASITACDFANFYLLSPQKYAICAQVAACLLQSAKLCPRVAQCALCAFIQTSYKHEKIMANFKNHFGDNASIDDETNERILEFLRQNLRQNLAEKSNSKWAIKLAKKDDIAIT